MSYKNFDAGHIKSSRGPYLTRGRMVPHPWCSPIYLKNCWNFKGHKLMADILIARLQHTALFLQISIP